MNQEPETIGISCKIVCILVHGTFAANSAWTLEDSKLRKSISDRFGSDSVIFERFQWAGAFGFFNNDANFRRHSAERLSAQIKETAHKHPGASIFVICHSHGGNVALYAMQDPETAVLVSGIATFATPFLWVYKKERGYITYIIVASFLVFFACPLAPFWPKLLPAAEKQLSERVAQLTSRFGFPDFHPDKVVAFRSPRDEAGAALKLADLIAAGPTALFGASAFWMISALAMLAVGLIFGPGQLNEIRTSTQSYFETVPFTLLLWLLFSYLAVLVVTLALAIVDTLVTSAIKMLSGALSPSPFDGFLVDVQTTVAPPVGAREHKLTSKERGIVHSRLYIDEHALGLLCDWIQSSAKLPPGMVRSRKSAVQPGRRNSSTVLHPVLKKLTWGVAGVYALCFIAMIISGFRLGTSWRSSNPPKEFNLPKIEFNPGKITQETDPIKESLILWMLQQDLSAKAHLKVGTRGELRAFLASKSSVGLPIYARLNHTDQPDTTRSLLVFLVNGKDPLKANVKVLEVGLADLVRVEILNGPRKGEKHYVRPSDVRVTGQTVWPSDLKKPWQ